MKTNKREQIENSRKKLQTMLKTEGTSIVILHAKENSIDFQLFLKRNWSETQTNGKIASLPLHLRKYQPTKNLKGQTSHDK